MVVQPAGYQGSGHVLHGEVGEKGAEVLEVVPVGFVRSLVARLDVIQVQLGDDFYRVVVAEDGSFLPGLVLVPLPLGLGLVFAAVRQPHLLAADGGVPRLFAVVPPHLSRSRHALT